MSNTQLCSTVNALTQAVCNMKTTSETTGLKNQMLFQNDFFVHRRMVTVSFIVYEYKTSENIAITIEELELIRDFLLAYLEKYNDQNLADIYLSYLNKTLKIAFVSYERTSKTSDTHYILTEIEGEINTIYNNSIFKLLNSIISPLNLNDSTVKLRDLGNSFKEGYYYSKNNVSIFVNRSELIKTILNWNNVDVVVPPPNPNVYDPGECNFDNCYCPNEPFSPFEPSSPFEPMSPSEPYDMIQLYKSRRVNETLKYSNDDFNTNLFAMINRTVKEDNPTNNDDNIKKIISKILEVTTTDEITQI